MAMQSFASKETRDFFVLGVIKKNAGWKLLAKVARRKLDMLHYAQQLEDLQSPPGNRLEALRGDWKGWHSVRINDQWRIMFRWTDLGPQEVKIIDYH